MVCEPDAAGDSAAPRPGETPHSSAKGRSFLRLFLQNERRLYGYVLTLLPNRADADDVLQEASLVMWDKFNENDPPVDFVAWGCRIAYFKVLDLHKKRQRSRVQFSQALLERLAETAVEQAATLQLDERQHALAECVKKLPARDQDLLVRRFSDGMSIQALAQQVERSADAVYKALAKIRLALFECVTRRLATEARP